jgi:hypothetical protein
MAFGDGFDDALGDGFERLGGAAGVLDAIIGTLLDGADP